MWGIALRSLFAPLILLSLAEAANAACVPLPQAPSNPHRPVRAQDIIELWEIGFPDGALSGPSPLAVSPDGQRIAFVVTRADLATNAYCRDLLVQDLSPGAKPRLVDTGGEFVPLGTFVRGLWVEVGLQKVTTPLWSPDGQSIAYLRRQDGITQARVIGLGLEHVATTHSDADVQTLWWGRGGRKLYFTSWRQAKHAELRIKEEGRSGWLYDDRMAPNDGVAPRLEAKDARGTTYSLDPETGAVEMASEVDPNGGSSGERRSSPTGAQAWLAPDGPSPVSPDRLWVKTRSGELRRCAADSCHGRFAGLWWAPGGKEIWFLKREGWNHGTSALYRWSSTRRSPIRSLSTDELLDNCQPAGARLACTAESTTRPRVIILVDPVSGARQTIFNPNPGFADLRLGTVTRLKWRNDQGLEAWGDLVLPPDYREGRRLPLIVVQYNSRGFLRGGTGNEYLIYPLAAAGYAVLSFDRPPPVASAHPELKTEVDLNAANEKGWAERRSMLSALLRGLDLTIALGVADPKRVGITGLSDGATSARFALLNSSRFAAAAISSCCLEPKTVMTYGGPRWAEFNRAIGYPPATIDDPEFWRPVSLALNAGRIQTPLLIQQSDDEYLLGLEAFEALREKQAPAELYVFPDEHHVKWQPRHKLAAFSRELDWFDFWLRCRKSEDPAKTRQYQRWREMRSHAGPSGELCPPAKGTSSTLAPKSRHQQGA